MNPPSEDIKDILESSQSGTGLVFGTDLFIGEEPVSPDQCITIYDTGGPEPQAGYVYDYPTVQVRIRGNKGAYKETWALADTIKSALHGLHNESWNGTKYHGIWCQSDIIFIGYDDNSRPVFTVNFRIHRSA